MSFIGLGVAVMILGGVESSQANTLTVVDTGISGYTWLTFDTTGLLGESKNDVLTAIGLAGVGDELYGYEYASRLQTEELLDSYFAMNPPPPPNQLDDDLSEDGHAGGWEEDTYAAAQAFTYDFGMTYQFVLSSKPYNYSYFLYGDVNDNYYSGGQYFTGATMSGYGAVAHTHNIDDQVVTNGLGVFHTGYGADASRTTVEILPNDYSSYKFSSLLVRATTPPTPPNPVPEPAAQV